MKIRSMIVVAAATMLVASYGCGKKEDGKPAEGQPAAPQQTLPPGHPTAPGSGPTAGAPADHGAIKSTKEVKISKEVAAKWKNVDIAVVDKAAKKQVALNVKVGEKTKLGGAYMIKVAAFVPDYTIYEDYIGSKTDKPNNPAIMTELYEGDKLVVRGWIFKNEMFATFNSFKSDKYDVVLLTPKGK